MIFVGRLMMLDNIQQLWRDSMIVFPGFQDISQISRRRSPHQLHLRGSIPAYGFVTGLQGLQEEHGWQCSDAIAAENYLGHQGASVEDRESKTMFSDCFNPKKTRIQGDELVLFSKKQRRWTEWTEWTCIVFNEFKSKATKRQEILFCPTASPGHGGGNHTCPGHSCEGPY